ncbi:PhzF family phenazine biosynthesis protein [Rhodosalinus sp. K401]|uniref:PhzF family phenazine biosynthesis protein n=1 Tax=Rhodosalinus sp. K401 TaxID=3239195 RepID=UPI0035252882
MTRIFVVDAFAEAPFTGNPAAVVPDAASLSEVAMQDIAAEMNLSETAFLTEANGAYRLRWFSPVHEVDFCGHATIATAHVLSVDLGLSGPFMFETRVGALRVETSVDGLVLEVPRLDPEPVPTPPAIIDEAFGADPVAVFRNFENLFVRLADEAAVRAADPPLARLAELFPLGVCITAPGREADFVSRYFAPGAGIPEDPVTGSTHATLAPYWAAELGRTRLGARQLSRRGGALRCDVGSDTVRIEGRAVTVIDGVLLAP